MQVLRQVLDFLGNSEFGVWGWPTIILILGVGIFLAIRMKALQVTKFRHMLSVTIVPTVKTIGKKRKDVDEKSITPFEAFSAAISR